VAQFSSLQPGMISRLCARYEVAKGSHIYEFGDHGALIVMAKDLEQTDTLYYSWSEGSQWQTLRFTDRPMEVQFTLSASVIVLLAAL